jgi:hypothetical protein
MHIPFVFQCCIFAIVNKVVSFETPEEFWVPYNCLYLNSQFSILFFGEQSLLFEASFANKHNTLILCLEFEPDIGSHLIAPWVSTLRIHFLFGGANIYFNFLMLHHLLLVWTPSLMHRCVYLMVHITKWWWMMLVSMTSSFIGFCLVCF